MARQALFTRLLTVTAAALVTVLAALAPLHAQDDSGVTITTTVNMNLRAGPTTNSAITGTLPAGATVPAIAREINAVNELWLLIVVDGDEVWIAGWLVTINGDADALPTGSPDPVFASPTPHMVYHPAPYSGPPLTFRALSIAEALQIAKAHPLHDNAIEGGLAECQELADGTIIVCTTAAVSAAIRDGHAQASALLTNEAFMARWWTTLLGVTAFGPDVSLEQLTALHADPAAALREIAAYQPAYYLPTLPSLTGENAPESPLPVSVVDFFDAGRLVIVQGHADLWDRGGAAASITGAAGHSRATAVDPGGASTIYYLFNSAIMQQPTAHQDTYHEFWIVSDLLGDLVNASGLTHSEELNWGAIIEFWFPPEFELSAEFRAALGI